ncbi:MAG: peptidylprolyl isomerase, partial [Nitrospinales bacterium]
MKSIMKLLPRSNRGIYLAFCLALLPVLSLSAQAAEVFDRIVAKVNSDIVTLSAVNERANLIKARMQEFPKEERLTEREILQKSLDSIINERLQVQEAKKLEMRVDSDKVLQAIEEIKKRNNLRDEEINRMLKADGLTFDQYKERIGDQILVSKVRNLQMRNRVRIGEKVIKKYYHDHSKEFWTLPKVHARHILFIIDEKIPPELARQKKRKADQLLRRIRRGADFIELAKEYSEDVSASSGGDLGILERGMMVKEFEDAAFKLKAGEVSDIVKTQYGLHIIKVDSVEIGKPKPYDEVKQIIERNLAAKEEKKYFKTWLKELRDAAFLEITLFDDPQKSRSVNNKNRGTVRSQNKPGTHKRKFSSKSQHRVPGKRDIAVSAKTIKNGAYDPGMDFESMEMKLRY